MRDAQARGGRGGGRGGGERGGKGGFVSPHPSSLLRDNAGIIPIAYIRSMWSQLTCICNEERQTCHVDQDWIR